MELLINRRILAWIIVALAVLAVAGSCEQSSGPRGMYQGGGDSSPGWW